jgi:hypothetical protein
VKTWILYIVVVWSTGPLDPGGQKTLLFEFDHLSECQSIADQVDRQIKEARSIFGLKQISCLRCTALFSKDNCPAPSKKR